MQIQFLTLSVAKTSGYPISMSGVLKNRGKCFWRSTIVTIYGHYLQHIKAVICEIVFSLKLSNDAKKFLKTF